MCLGLLVEVERAAKRIGVRVALGQRSQVVQEFSMNASTEENS